jgi:hypothetical protein
MDMSATERQHCAVPDGSDTPLSRTELAAAMAEAVRQWSPYERVPDRYPFRGENVEYLYECGYCGARGNSPVAVHHEEGCSYQRARQVLEKAREEGLI